LYVPDVEPGLALKTLARFAARIALIAENSRKYFANKSILTVTGHPVRKGLADWESGQAYEQFELDPNIPTLLIFGGSKGARSINFAVLDLLEKLLPDMQVLHISGELDWPKVEQARDALTPELAKNYRAYPYLHEEMGAAYTVADLIVSRAGASSVGEFPLFGAPAILVPYPHAWRYQKVNADYLVENGAAVLLEDQNLSAKLFDTIAGLMHNQSRRNSMGQAMKSLAQPEAAYTLARHLSELASQL
jgi:UDP-N-acetylglucosamine--N-acetylmuramyl-(pentapeptide) pyrophosphoryl-undecaprenol N-acetylglucosamine transferase